MRTSLLCLAGLKRRLGGPDSFPDFLGKNFENGELNFPPPQRETEQLTNENLIFPLTAVIVL